MRCGVSYAVVVFGFLLRFFVFAVVVISCEVLGFFELFVLPSYLQFLFRNCRVGFL